MHFALININRVKNRHPTPPTFKTPACIVMRRSEQHSAHACCRLLIISVNRGVPVRSACIFFFRNSFAISFAHSHTEAPEQDPWRSAPVQNVLDKAREDALSSDQIKSLLFFYSAVTHTVKQKPSTSVYVLYTRREEV